MTSATINRTVLFALCALLLAGCGSDSQAEFQPDEDGGLSMDDAGDPNDPGDPSDPERPSTGPVSHMFVPTGEPANTRAPKLALDTEGNLHAVYPAYAGGDAYYAFCPDQCSDPEAIRVVRLETQGTVLNAMIALTKAGAPRVLLTTLLDVRWAECDGDCTDPANWENSVILEHGGDREVSGNALALDINDHPRFVMHTYIALFGVNQKAPQTFYVQCDADCGNSESWSSDVIQEQIWQASQLRFDSKGRAHLATVAVTLGGGGPTERQAAYAACDRGCTSAADWSGIILMSAYEDYVEEINPAIALSLTERGGPRIALLGEGESGGKNLTYFECDEACNENHWRAAVITENAELGSGVDIALDGANHPRVALTLGGNIGVYHCEEGDCTSTEATWDLGKVEFASDIPEDDIILWPNCTIDAWDLQDPSLVLAKNGTALVGYQAADLSGGVTTTDPTKPACLAGKDMTLTRLTRVPKSAQ